MRNNIINDVISELKVFTDQLEKGVDLSPEQLMQSKQCITTINDLNSFIQMGGEIEGSQLRSALNYGNIMLGGLSELPSQQLNAQSNEFILDASKSTQKLLHSVNNSLLQNQEAAQHNGSQYQQVVESEVSAFKLGLKTAQFAGGLAAGGLAGAGLGIKAAMDYMKGFKMPNNSNAEQTNSQQRPEQRPEQPQAAPASDSQSHDNVSHSTNLATHSQQSAETSIAKPSQSFSSFSEQQSEKAFTESIDNSFSALAMAGELSNHESLVDSELANKIVNNLENNLSKLEDKSDQLSDKSKLKFQEASQKLSDSLENVEVDPEASERMRLVMEKAIEQLKKLFSKLSGKDNDQSNSFSQS